MYADSDSDGVEFVGYKGRGGHAPPARKASLSTPKEIIELSDSSGDEAKPRAGPSVQRRPDEARNVPLFLPDSDKEQETVAPPVPVPEAAPRPEDTLALEVVNPNDFYVARVLDIIPDVDPAYVLGLVERSEGDVVGNIVNVLLENPTYPKVQNKGKGKRKRDDEDDNAEGGSGTLKVVKIDYASKDRRHLGGPLYHELAIEQLCLNFPFIPLAHIRRTFALHNVLYAPTFLALQAELYSGQLPYQRLTHGSAASRSRSKGKRPDRVDEELEKEKRWLIDKAEADKIAQDAQIAEQLQDAEDCQIECGCCFTENPLRKMIQCPDAHLFCRDCMSRYSETKLGEHDINIVCMDQSGCKLVFHEEELKKVLSEKLLELYYRVKQRKEIEAAGVENLEECPFCDYKVIIENPHEKLFRCARDECGIVSCRACKKPDHLPKSCEEADSDKKLDARHAVEEAMTRALLRNCPSCSKAFMKEAGCNKMTCPNCKTLSCYVCRKIIKGYDHFNQVRPQMPGNSVVTDSTKCPLWDQNVDQRHADEVAAAAKRALEEMKRANPDVDDKDLQVELPKAVAGPSNVAARPAVVAAGAARLIDPVPPNAPVHNRLHAQQAVVRERRLREAVRERELELVRHRAAIQEVHRRNVQEIHARLQAERPVRALPRANAVHRHAAPLPPAPIVVHHHHPQYRAGQVPNVTVTMNGRQVLPQRVEGGAMVFVLDDRMQAAPVPPPAPAPAPAPVPLPALLPAVAPAQRRRRR